MLEPSSTDAPIALAIAVLLSAWAVDVVGRLRGVAELGSSYEARAPGVPIELAGEGLACVDGATARKAAVARYERVCEAAAGWRPCGRMSVQRRLLIGAPLDGRTASAQELEALPGIGPALARRIVEARPPTSEATRSLAAAHDGAPGADGQPPAPRPLVGIRGIGARRAAALAPFLALDDTALSDICSTGLWPTTSSGSGRLR